MERTVVQNEHLVKFDLYKMKWANPTEAEYNQKDTGVIFPIWRFGGEKQKKKNVLFMLRMTKPQQ